MLGKLRVEHGHNNVNKISQMFTDLTISEDMVKEYQASTYVASQGTEIFSIKILTKAFWPIKIVS